MKTFDVKMKNTLDDFGVASEGVDEFLDGVDGSPKAMYCAKLALEEMVTNIIKYGYDDKDEHEIELTLQCDGQHLYIRLVDDGHEFDPLALPEPPRDKPIEEREVGGLGIFLTRKTVEKMEYERRDNLNILQMTLSLQSAPAL